MYMNKFDDRINQLYTGLLQEAEPTPVGEVDPKQPDASQAELQNQISDTEMGMTRRFIDKKKILGLNIGISRKLSKGLEKRKELEDDLENTKMPGILDKLKAGNKAIEDEIASVK